MDNPRGRVLSITSTPDNTRAIVIVANMPVCQRCASGKGCGAGLVGTGRGPQQIEAAVSPGLCPGIGDEVELRISPDNLLRAAFLLYVLPLLGAIIGGAVAFGLSTGDAGAALLAIVGLGGGLLVSRRQLGATACVQRFTPTIERLC